jgi:hypothetical protein
VAPLERRSPGDVDFFSVIIEQDNLFPQTVHENPEDEIKVGLADLPQNSGDLL